MKVIITGSTGMIGKGVLLECIDISLITEVLVVNRTPLNFSHPKIKEIICADWFDLSGIENKLKGYDACFFCLGATITTLSEQYFRKISYDLTLNFIQTISKLNPSMGVCYISGMGVDGAKKKKSMWIQIKGEVEQALLKEPLKWAYIFRPGYIQPMRGVRSKTKLYRIFYILLSPFYPIFRRLFPRLTTSTVQIGKAMIYLTQNIHVNPFLENSDINKLAQNLGNT
jgi:uncharacterized protein YbjT (DUF2867 family)